MRKYYTKFEKYKEIFSTFAIEFYKSYLRNIMARITLNYRQNNKQAQNLLNYVVSTGLFVPEVAKNSGLATALADLENGRVYHAARRKQCA